MTEAVEGQSLDLSVHRVAPRRLPPSGVTFLLLHGWPGTRADWDLVLPAFESGPLARSQALVPDLRGFGASGRPAGGAPAEYAPSAHLGDLRRLLDAAGATRVVVAGYDIGATLAQQLARADDRVTALVLGCPVYPGIGERRFEPAVQAELWYQHLHNLPWAPDLVAHDRATVETYLRHFYVHWWGEGRVDEAHFQRTVGIYAAPGAFEASIGWYRARAQSPGEPGATPSAVRPITVPTVVLWGQRDPVIPIRFADRLAEHFSRLDVHRLVSVGHFIPLEAPSAMAGALARLVTTDRDQ